MTTDTTELDDIGKHPTYISNARMGEILVTYYKHVGGGVVSFDPLFTVSVGGVQCSISCEVGMWDEVQEGTRHPYAKMHRLCNAMDKALIEGGAVLPTFRWRPHQIGEGERLWDMIDREGWGMLRHMPRTGKTGTLLYALEHSSEPMKVLIVTTKNAVKGIKGAEGGWVGFVKLAQESGWCMKHSYAVSTPHRVGKHTSGAYDLVVMDESHKIYSDPKPVPSAMWGMTRMVIADAKVVFVTATPHAQSINQLYWQLSLCKYNPFLVSGIGGWGEYFSKFGKPYTIIIGNGVAIPQYDKGDIDGIYALCGRGILSLSQEEVGFSEELLPVDVPHYIEITGTTRLLMDKYKLEEVVALNDVMVHTMNSRDVEIRLHQMEGGTLKYVDVFSIVDESTGLRRRGVKPVEHNWILPTLDKVKYIKDTWGDTSDMVIMYNYVNEGKLLRREFKNAKVYQGKTHSEGIDLWQYKHLIIYAMDWSVATYVQRRDRQVSLGNRKEGIEVHYLLTKGGVSEDIYKSVVERGESLTYGFYGKDSTMGSTKVEGSKERVQSEQCTTPLSSSHRSAVRSNQRVLPTVKLGS